MADSILRLKVENQEYDNKLKRAAEGIQRYAEGCRKAGGTLEHLDDGVEQFVKELGKMETTSKSAKGSLNEMTKSFTDLSMEYKHLTDQEKSAPFGKALSASLDQLRDRIQQTKSDLSDINSKLGVNIPSAGGGGLFGGDMMSGMLQVFGGNLLTKGAGMAMSFASEMGDMIKQGIELARQTEGVRMAFERLNNANLLDNLRQATHGTVTDLELMKAAVQFNNFNLPLEELGTMLAFAQQKAKDTGQSVDYMVSSIVTGLGRKSLMILDNLGLSAAEIRDKMKETGDMTKAVGEIIREQMSKAGEYVETAADRATQANVELTNSMTRLGETFQPISDMGTSMWTSLKTGALDLLNNVLEPLINKFTELGRIRSQYANQGGDERVDRMLGRLRGIGTDTYRRGTYKAQLANFDSKIGSYQQYLADYKRWQSDKTAVGSYDRMQAFQKQTGLSMYSDVKEQLAVFQKMRAEYVNGAKAILQGNPAPSPTDTTTTTTTTGGKVNTFDASKIAFDVNRAMLAAEKGVDQGPSGAYQAFLESERKNTDTMKSLTDALERLNESEGISKKGTGEQNRERNRKGNPYLHEGEDGKQTAKLNEVLGGVAGGMTQIAGGLEQMGIEIPEGINKAIGVVQGISAILTGIATTLIAIEAISAADTIIPFARGGIVPHAANGYYVPGNHYSGDVTPILANAGELVLSRSQQNALAGQLQGSGMAGMQLSAVITGEQLRLVLNNNGRRTGRGEYVTTNFR